jgi:hypothetical protein
MTLQTMSFIFGALLLAVGILGGGFEVKEIKVSNVTTGARIFAGLVGVVFVVLGFWQPGTLTSPIPVVAAATMSEREHDKNRWGGDYTGFDIGSDHVEVCENTCKDDTKCLAWTYVKPGIQGPQARCWLKNVIPAISNDVCCVSGTKTRSH